MASYKENVKAIASSDLPWELLSGAKILVVGATGLIGSCLIDVLVCKKIIDYDVYAIGRNEARASTRFAPYFENPHFHFICHDITEPLNVDITFDYVIHAASHASPHFFVNEPVETMKTNIYGLCNLMDYGVIHGMKRMLFVSTGEVYGEGDGRVFNEEYSGFINLLAARSCYPSSKRACETLCASYAQEYGIDFVIARPTHIYGPHFTEVDNRVFAQFIRNVINREDIVLKSDGSQIRSWCYVTDCVAALLFILLKGASGEAYNIADPASTVTIKELAETIASISGQKVVFELPSTCEKSAFNPVKCSQFSTVKLEALGWKPCADLYQNLVSSIEDCR